MELKAWRLGKGWSQRRMADAFGIAGANPASQIERIENGKIKAEADLIDAIERVTEGEVTAVDMQATRLAYLREAGKAREFEPAAGSPE